MLARTTAPELIGLAALWMLLPAPWARPGQHSGDFQSQFTDEEKGTGATPRSLRTVGVRSDKRV